MGQTSQYSTKDETILSSCSLFNDKKLYFWKEGKSSKCGRTVWATQQAHTYLRAPDLYPPFPENRLDLLKQQVQTHEQNVPTGWNNHTSLEQLVYHLLQVTCKQKERRDTMTWKNLKKPTIQDLDRRQLTTLNNGTYIL